MVGLWRWCSYGRTVAIVLIRVSFDSVTSSVLRLVDLAIRMAIILMSPLVLGELLNSDTVFPHIVSALE